MDEFILYSLGEDQQLAAMVKLYSISSLNLCFTKCKNNVLCSGVEYTQSNSSCHMFNQSATTAVDKEEESGERLLYLRPMDQIARG